MNDPEFPLFSLGILTSLRRLCFRVTMQPRFKSRLGLSFNYCRKGPQLNLYLDGPRPLHVGGPRRSRFQSVGPSVRRARFAFRTLSLPLFPTFELREEER